MRPKFGTNILREGGESAVASEYVQAIHDALKNLDSEAAGRLPGRSEEE